MDSPRANGPSDSAPTLKRRLSLPIPQRSPQTREALPPTPTPIAEPAQWWRWPMAQWRHHRGRRQRAKKIYRAEQRAPSVGQHVREIETPHGTRRRLILEAVASTITVEGWRLAALQAQKAQLDFVHTSGARVSIRLLSPKETRAYARTVYFSVTYESAQPLSLVQRSFLETAVEVLRRHERTLESIPGFPGALFDRRPASLAIYPRRYKVELRPSLICDHHCGFCNSVDYSVENFAQGVRDVLALADIVAPLPIIEVTLTGGEPTLLPELPRAVAAFAGQGLRVVLQTNGMALADRGYARRLKLAGLEAAHISLHSHDARVSDEQITHFAGGWARTVAGIDHALAAGIEVSISHVVHAANADGLEAFASFVAGRWGSRVLLSISFVAPTGGAGQEGLKYVPPMGPAAEAIRRGLDLCRLYGLHALVQAYCGVPPCLLGSHWFMSEVPYMAPREYPADRVHPPACDGCAFRRQCPGLWRGYYELHGDPGVRPFTDGPWHRLKRTVGQWWQPGKHEAVD